MKNLILLFTAALLQICIVPTTGSAQDLLQAYSSDTYVQGYITGIKLDTIPVVTIKAARELPIGTQFITEGVVTRTQGSYTRIQDITGGLTIIQESGTFFTGVQTSDIAMGDIVRVEGRISEKNFLKVITANDLISHLRISRLNTLPTPKKVTLSEIANNGALYESCLIRVENLTITNDSDISYREYKTYQIMDSSERTNTVVVHIGKNADTDMDGKPLMTTSVLFEGVLSQSSSVPLCGYQLTPVLQSDLRTTPNDVSEALQVNRSSLSNNYPNPFNSSTTIQYNLAKQEFVSLKVLNVLGNEVAVLVNTVQSSGLHSALFTLVDNAISLGNSVYFYRLQVGTSVTSKQMIYVK